MKISYRTHPILESLDKKELANIRIFDCDKVAANLQQDFIRKKFKQVSLGINNQIYHLSDSFLEAYEKAGDKLFEAKLFDDVEDDNICFITNRDVTLMNIRRIDSEKQILLSSCMFTKSGAACAIGDMLVSYKTGKWQQAENFLGFLSSNEGNAFGHLFNCMLITLFIKYADVETKLLLPGRKDEGITCNYKNDTRTKITFLDSKWFTTLVKSDAFKVRGHFRLQPKKKDGEWTKELIWINEFEKSGYTAPARKLS